MCTVLYSHSEYTVFRMWIKKNSYFQSSYYSRSLFKLRCWRGKGQNAAARNITVTAYRGGCVTQKDFPRTLQWKGEDQVLQGGDNKGQRWTVWTEMLFSPKNLLARFQVSKRQFTRRVRWDSPASSSGTVREKWAIFISACRELCEIQGDINLQNIPSL